jgi:hypothetical protein
MVSSTASRIATTRPCFAGIISLDAVPHLGQIRYTSRHLPTDAFFAAMSVTVLP